MKKFVFGVIATIALFVVGLVWFVKLPVYAQSTKTTRSANTHTIEQYELPAYNKGVVLVKSNQSTETLVVFLHGYGGDERSFVTRRLLNELGKPEYAHMSMVFPASSKQSFWHNRSAAGPEKGDWADYVVQDVLVDAKKRIGNTAPKVDIAGISMGGFGALHIAELHPELFCGVAGHSAAIWTESGKVASGSFDSKEEFDGIDVITHMSELKGLPVWLDNGDKDWFMDGASAVEQIAVTQDINLTKNIYPGSHDHLYWDAHWPEYLKFYAQSAENCRL